MTAIRGILAASVLVSTVATATAQGTDFNLTYHVERFATSQLSLDDCGEAASQAAQAAGLAAGQQSVETLFTVSGGETGVGSFVVQCIAVDGTTVAVVHGIDYGQTKGAIGLFADQAFAAIRAAAG